MDGTDCLQLLHGRACTVGQRLGILGTAGRDARTQSKQSRARHAWPGPRLVACVCSQAPSRRPPLGTEAESSSVRRGRARERHEQALETRGVAEAGRRRERMELELPGWRRRRPEGLAGRHCRADGRAGVRPRRHWSGEAHLGTRAWVNWDLARSCRSASWRRDWLPPAMDLASSTATPKANGSRASFDHRRRGLTLSLTGRCHRLVVDGGPVRGLAPCCEPCEPRPADEEMLRNTQDTLLNEACQCRNPAALHISWGAYREYGTAQHSTESCCSTYVCAVVVLCSAVPVWTAAAAAPSLLAAVMHLSTQHIRWMHVASTSTALEQATAQLALPCLKPHAPEGGWWATKCGCTIAAKSSYKQPRPRRRPFRGSQGSGLPATFRARQ